MTPVKNERTDGTGGTGGTAGKEKRKPDTARGHTFTAIKNSLQIVGRGISNGTDKIADVFIDDSEEKRRERRKAKGQRLKKETMTMVKSVVSGIRSNMEGASFSGVVSDIFYGAGRLSRRLWEIEYAVILHRTCREAGKFSKKAGCLVEELLSIKRKDGVQ